MRFFVSERRFRASALAVGFVAISLSACQGGGGGGFLGMGESRRAAPQEDLARITDTELRAYCPRVLVPEARSVLRTYQRGGDGDAAKLVLQASIDDSTRACSYGDGTLTLNVAVAGRLVPGPAGGAGSTPVPVRFTVTQGDRVVFENVQRQTIAASEGGAAVQFVFNEPAIVIPAPTARDVMVTVGFDIPEQPRRDPFS
jgi:hypothetical protein